MEAVALKTWRKAHELTQVQLAELLGVSPLAVSFWERGARRTPALLPLALEALESRLQRSETHNTTTEGRAMQMERYEVRMTVYATVAAGDKQEAKDKVMEALHGNPLINEVWVTKTSALPEVEEPPREGEILL